MQEQVKKVQYNASNTYHTINQLTGTTRNIWLVFHGIGYLSHYFLKYFNELDPALNYVIAPQAPSKYYLNNQYKHVGASWLTRVDTAMGISNVLNYLDAVYKAEGIPGDRKLIVFGFSQGVSIAMRWLARSKVRCRELILYAGGVPEELKPEDFEFLDKNSRVTFLVGDTDEYLTSDRMEDETEKIIRLFKGKADIRVFKGGHEIKKELLQDFAV